MAKQATIKQPDEYQPRDAAHWQQIFPHNLHCTIEFITDKQGKVDVIITTTDHAYITDRPTEIPKPGESSGTVIYTAGYENLPDQNARNLEPAYFTGLLIKRMIYNLARFYPTVENMIQHVAWILGVKTAVIRAADLPRDKWTKVDKKEA